MYQTVAMMVTKACHPIVNHASFTLNNDGVSPVETQDFASPVQKARQRQVYIHLASLRIIACETQDFASLLWITHIYSALFS